MDLNERELMKGQFDEKIAKLISEKAVNCVFLSQTKYLELISEVTQLKQQTTRKTPSDYHKLKRFDIAKDGDYEKLIYPVSGNKQTILYYVHTDELFDIIHETHLSIGHGGRTKMTTKIKKKYKNITAEAIMIYLILCETCQRKFSSSKKDVVVTPMGFNNISRSLVNLIDMQSREDQGFKFILIYQDHSTKFIILRVLKTKKTSEVASELLNIFATFGAPCVIRSSNGRDFAKRIVEEVCAMWTELKIVHGNSENQADCVNRDVENTLYTWLDTNQTTKWSDGINFVQFMLNQSYNDEIKCTPFEAMFGHPARLGLTSANFPQEDLKFVRSEEDLDQLMNGSQEWVVTKIEQF